MVVEDSNFKMALADKLENWTIHLMMMVLKYDRLIKNELGQLCGATFFILISIS
jgi:hypothetical protein